MARDSTARPASENHEYHNSPTDSNILLHKSKTRLVTVWVLLRKSRGKKEADPDSRMKGAASSISDWYLRFYSRSVSRKLNSMHQFGDGQIEAFG